MCLTVSLAHDECAWNGYPSSTVLAVRERHHFISGDLILQGLKQRKNTPPPRRCLTTTAAVRMERQRQRSTRSASQLAVAIYKSGSTLFGARYKASTVDLERLDLLPSSPSALTIIFQIVPSAQPFQTDTFTHLFQIHSQRCRTLSVPTCISSSPPSRRASTSTWTAAIRPMGPKS